MADYQLLDLRLRSAGREVPYALDSASPMASGAGFAGMDGESVSVKENLGQHAAFWYELTDLKTFDSDQHAF
jgi:hypothetical protein